MSEPGEDQPPGPLPRWPLAVFGAAAVTGVVDGLAGGGLEVSELAAAGLAFGTLAAWTHAGPLGGGLGAALGLALAGLIAPLGLSPGNWSLVLVGLALGAARAAPPSRPKLRIGAMILLLLGVALAVEGRGLGWAVGIAGGLLGASRAFAPFSGVWPGRLLALGVLLGLLRTVNLGFMRVSVQPQRAVLAEWGPNSLLIPGGSRAVAWTRGRPMRFRASVDGPSFLELPLNPGAPPLPERKPDAVDRAEIGLSADCEALMPLALSGDRRALVQARAHRCDPELSSMAASDPVVDAVGVLQGSPSIRPAALLSEAPTLPLDDPDAVVLVAQLRLGAEGACALAFEAGSAFDRAVLLEWMGPEDRSALRGALESRWEERGEPPPPEVREATLSALGPA